MYLDFFQKKIQSHEGIPKDFGKSVQFDLNIIRTVITRYFFTVGFLKNIITDTKKMYNCQDKVSNAGNLN